MAITHFGDHAHGEEITGTEVHPAKSLASIIAICASIASYILSARGSEFWGFGLAILAIICGIIGTVRALSPRVSGGVLSILAIVMGAIAVLVAIVALVV